MDETSKPFPALDLLTTHLAACKAQGLATSTISQRRRAIGRFTR